MRWVLPAVLALLAGAVSCGERAGDSGGAGTGDSLVGGAGSAESNDRFEAARPRDTTLPSRIPDARGRDTT